MPRVGSGTSGNIVIVPLKDRGLADMWRIHASHQPVAYNPLGMDIVEMVGPGEIGAYAEFMSGRPDKRGFIADWDFNVPQNNLFPPRAVRSPMRSVAGQKHTP